MAVANDWVLFYLRILSSTDLLEKGIIKRSVTLKDTHGLAKVGGGLWRLNSSNSSIVKRCHLLTVYGLSTKKSLISVVMNLTI